MRRVLFLMAWAFGLNSLSALQKVIILPIINIDKDANFAFLEESISNSLKQRLREKLAFDELAEDKWALIAEQNFILREDFHTRTAAMNLGILANQDIVISGGYKATVKKLGGGNIKTSIQATAYLLDVKKKKTIVTIEVNLPADSELFAAVGKLAEHMEIEARKVIPSKEDAARSGLRSESAPFFSDWSVGISAGGGFYFSGYAKHFSPQLPALGATIKAHVPRFASNLTVTGGFIFLNHRLKEGDDSVIQTLGAAGTTSNYISSLSLGYQLALSPKLYLEPQVGGGYVMQSTSVSRSGTNFAFANGFPFVRGGLILGYRINTIIDTSLSAESLAYIESGTVTYVPLLLGGVNYKF